MGAGGSAVNVLLANDGNDTLVATIQAGTLGSNRLFGHNGNDRLQVGGGDGNLLNAGQGRDVLIGGFGGDTFVGGGGVDTFVFSSEAGGADVITDFGRDDRIAITGLVDQGARGLLNDLVAAVDTVTQASRGAPVDVRFDDGATLRFHLVGVTGAIELDHGLHFGRPNPRRGPLRVGQASEEALGIDVDGDADRRRAPAPLRSRRGAPAAGARPWRRGPGAGRGGGRGCGRSGAGAGPQTSAPTARSGSEVRASARATSQVRASSVPVTMTAARRP